MDVIIKNRGHGKSSDVVNRFRMERACDNKACIIVPTSGQRAALIDNFNFSEEEAKHVHSCIVYADEASGWGYDKILIDEVEWVLGILLAASKPISMITVSMDSTSLATENGFKVRYV